jgi:rhamnogalacturonan endolyase
MKLTLLKLDRSHQLARTATVFLALAAAIAAPRAALATFGFTASNGGYIVNNGANLVFTITSAGDMSSCKYKGTELNDTSKASCIASGLSASSVTATTVSGNIIVVKCVSTASEFGNLTHYYIVTNGIDNIYMATYPTQ